MHPISGCKFTPTYLLSSPVGHRGGFPPSCRAANVARALLRAVSALLRTPGHGVHGQMALTCGDCTASAAPAGVPAPARSCPHPAKAVIKEIIYLITKVNNS